MSTYMYMYMYVGHNVYMYDSMRFCASTNSKCFSATTQAVCRFQRVPSTTHPSTTHPSTTPPSSLPQSTTQSSVMAASTGPKKQPHRQQKSIAAVFPTPPPSHTPTTTAATVHSSMTDDQKTTLKHSTTHPTTVTASSDSSSSTLTSSSLRSTTHHQPAKVQQSFSVLGTSLPQIYMHSSQPHSVVSGTGKGRGMLRNGVQPKPVVREGEMQQKIEVVANLPPSQQATATTAHNVASSHTQSLAATPQTAATVTSRTPLPDTSPQVSTSFTTHTRAPPSQTTGIGPSPRIIGNDSARVRPTHSDFEALQRRHQHMVPTPIPMATDLMSNPLKMAVSGSLLLGDLSITPPISTAPLSKKDAKTTQQDKTNYNVRVNVSHNIALPGTEKGSVKMMQPPSLIQKPMPLLDMPVLVPPLVQNPGNTFTTLKESSSLKDTSLMKGTSKTNQLNLVKGKGKESLDTIKITPGHPMSNISTGIMGPKSLSSVLDSRSYSENELTTPSPVASTDSADSAPQFPPSVPTRSDSTGSDSPLPVKRAPLPLLHSPLSSRDSFSPSADDDCDAERSPTVTSVGPLVEYTNTYSGHPASGSTGSDVDEESPSCGWGVYDNNCGSGESGREEKFRGTRGVESHPHHSTGFRRGRGSIPNSPSSNQPMMGRGRAKASVIPPHKTSPASRVARGNKLLTQSAGKKGVGVGAHSNHSSPSRAGESAAQRPTGRGGPPQLRQQHQQPTFRVTASKPPGRQGTGRGGKK